MVVLLEVYIMRYSGILPEIIVRLKGSGILIFTNTKPQDVSICVNTVSIPGSFLDVGCSLF